MADFRCRLASATGEIVERDFTAEDAATLRRDLERQDFLVLQIAPRSAVAGVLSSFMERRQRIPMSEFLIFNQEFAALVRAGLPIIECLTLLLERRKNPIFKAALEDVRDRVKGGEALSDAFAAHNEFPALYASTLASGERSGEIATVLGRYVNYTKTILNVRSRVIAALTYPAVLVCLAVIIVTILMIYVLPKFQEFFADFQADLPIYTEAVIFVSHVMRNYFFLWFGTLLGGVVLFLVWRKTPAGRRGSEKLMYRIPLVGPIAQSFVVSRFSRTLATLLAGGIPLVTALEVVSRAIGTPIYRQSIEEVGQSVREGGALWTSLEETKIFPELMVEMTKVGESSGSLAQMLEYVADFIDQEVEQRLQRVVSLVEPIMLVFMALFVGLLLLSIYYPMLQMYGKSNMGGM